ncbi:hypothetical protein GGX14DRAFT_564744 [Mycena pura]|uniref:Uncharacterized protein n=1 Tax=Mycena pura TaxID=153505 RepID=A0AAD6YBS4_9AGAR|nr:hypothetical protein GGX14DRAFT_564744 [Mycena pura]
MQASSSTTTSLSSPALSSSSALSYSSTSTRHKNKCRRGRRERLREKEIEVEVSLQYDEFKAYMNSVDEYATDAVMRAMLREDIISIRSAKQIRLPKWTWEDRYEQMC